MKENLTHNVHFFNFALCQAMHAKFDINFEVLCFRFYLLRDNRSISLTFACAEVDTFLSNIFLSLIQGILF